VDVLDEDELDADVSVAVAVAASRASFPRTVPRMPRRIWLFGQEGSLPRAMSAAALGECPCACKQPWAMGWTHAGWVRVEVKVDDDVLVRLDMVISYLVRG
jgi:hypothetical protein